MFCHKCGSKSPEGATFCQKCGAKLIQDVATTQATDESVSVTTPISVKTSRSPTAKVSRVAQESSAPKSMASSEGATEVYNLLKENMSSCSAIKAVTQAKNGTVLKGTIRKYLIVIAASGQAVIVSSLAFPFIILDWTAYGLMCMIAANIGWEFMEYGSIHFEDFSLMFAVSLLIGGLIKTITPFLGFKEKEAISTYVSEIAESKGIALAEGTAKTKVPAARLAVSIIPALIGAIILIFVIMDNFGFGGGGDVPAATIEHSASSIVDNVSLSQTYTNEDEGFLFMYPGNWDVKEESTMVAVFAPAESGYSASIAIMKSDADETYFSATMSDFESLYSSGKDSFRMLDLSDITLSGHSARKLIYTYNDNRGSYTQVQYFYIVNSEMYFVTCSSLKEYFDKYVPVFDTIMDSYTITATDTSGKSGTVNSYPSISYGYEGISIDYLLGSVDNVIFQLGDSQLNDEFKLRYDDLEFYHDNGTITSIVCTAPSLLEADGVPLNKNREGLIEIFGQPSEEGNSGGGYYMSYDLPQCSMSFELGEPDSETWRTWISPSATTKSALGEILYRGQPFSLLLGSTPEDLNKIFGAPTGGTPVTGDYLFGEVKYYEYSDITFLFDYEEMVDSITVAANAVEVNGTALNQNRTGIINLLGAPGYEGQQFHGEPVDYYLMEYTSKEEKWSISIQFPDTTSKANNVSIVRYFGGYSNEEYQEP